MYVPQAAGRGRARVVIKGDCAQAPPSWRSGGPIVPPIVPTDAVRRLLEDGTLCLAPEVYTALIPLAFDMACKLMQIRADSRIMRQPDSFGNGLPYFSFSHPGRWEKTSFFASRGRVLDQGSEVTANCVAHFSEFLFPPRHYRGYSLRTSRSNLPVSDLFPYTLSLGSGISGPHIPRSSSEPYRMPIHAMYKDQPIKPVPAHGLPQGVSCSPQESLFLLARLGPKLRAAGPLNSPGVTNGGAANGHSPELPRPSSDLPQAAAGDMPERTMTTTPSTMPSKTPPADPDASAASDLCRGKAPVAAVYSDAEAAVGAKLSPTASPSHESVHSESQPDEISCQNCATTTTPLWRRDEHGQTLCNACGLFLKLHGRRRPISLKTDVIKPRNRARTALNIKRQTRKGRVQPSSQDPEPGSVVASHLGRYSDQPELMGQQPSQPLTPFVSPFMPSPQISPSTRLHGVPVMCGMQNAPVLTYLPFGASGPVQPKRSLLPPINAPVMGLPQSPPLLRELRSDPLLPRSPPPGLEQIPPLSQIPAVNLNHTVADLGTPPRQGLPPVRKMVGHGESPSLQPLPSVNSIATDALTSSPSRSAKTLCDPPATAPMSMRELSMRLSEVELLNDLLRRRIADLESAEVQAKIVCAQAQEKEQAMHAQVKSFQREIEELRRRPTPPSWSLDDKPNVKRIKIVEQL